MFHAALELKLILILTSFTLINTNSYKIGPHRKVGFVVYRVVSNGNLKSKRIGFSFPTCSRIFPSNQTGSKGTESERKERKRLYLSECTGERGSGM